MKFPNLHSDIIKNPTKYTGNRNLFSLHKMTAEETLYYSGPEGTQRHVDLYFRADNGRSYRHPILSSMFWMYVRIREQSTGQSFKGESIDVERQK